MANQRRAGIAYIKVDGQLYDAKGNFSYNLGRPKRETLLGSDTVHGFMEKPQAPYIEGEITDRGDLDLEKLVTMENATVQLELANGKVIVVREAWYAADGKGQSEEGNIEFRFEGKSGEEVS